MDKRRMMALGMMGGVGDSVAPTVVITSTENNPTFATTIPLTITFSEPVTGFVVGDIIVAGCTLSAFAGSGADYTVIATPTANTLTVDIVAGVCIDAAGNANEAATQFVIVALIYGLNMWLKADVGTFSDAGRTTPVTANDSIVGGWADQSGKGNHGSQSGVDSLKPLLKTNIQNGLPCIRFDGLTARLTHALDTNNSPTSIYAVIIRRGADLVTYNVIFGSKGILMASRLNSNSSWGAFFNFDVRSGVTLATDEGHILVMVVRNYNDVDFVTDGSVITRNTGIGFYNSQKHIGASDPASGQMFRGDIGELLVYSGAHNLATYSLIGNYLEARWGINFT